MTQPTDRNVIGLQQDNTSILRLCRKLIRLRKETPALCLGDYRPLRGQNDILLYERSKEGARFTIALNLVHQPRRIQLPDRGQLELPTHLDRRGSEVEPDLFLRADEGVIIRRSS